MKNFKEIAVLADVYEMSRGKNITVRDKVSDPILLNRIFSLADASKRNANYKNSRRWVEIDWEKTALTQLEAGNLGWLEYAKNEKELECRSLKRKIKFPIKESYKEAVSDGEWGNNQGEQLNDYISVVEDQLDILDNIEFKPAKKEIAPKKEEGDIDELKAIIKEEDLGVRVTKNDSFDSITEKIEKARANK